jgi:trehalose/maltose hydrolase-like predicted phosphorylase
MTAAGLHLATIGGVWQALLSGFAGARVRGGALLLDPRLPAAWPELEIRFLALNRRVRVHVDAAGLRVWSDGPLPVRLSGDREVRLPGGREVHLGALPPQGRQPERSLVEGGLR